MELSTILYEAALSGNDTLRRQAEAKIDIIATQDFGGFLLNLSSELSDESKDKGIRQVASTLIKNMITKQDKYKGQWLNLAPEVKLEVKQRVLSTLASADNDIRKAASLAVAGICKIELPLSQWTDIVEILCQTAKNQELNIKIASIITLGYIAVEVTPRDISDEQMCSVLSTIHHLLINDQENVEVHINTMETLLNFINFCKKFFEIKVINYIILGTKKTYFRFSLQVL